MKSVAILWAGWLLCSHQTLIAQPVNGFVVLERDGANATDFDNAPVTVPFATILNQSEVGPNFFIGYYRGQCLTIERDLVIPIRTARETLSTSLVTQPNELDWALLAKIEIFLRNLGPAHAAAESALQLNPRNADAMFVIAEVSFREGNYERCLDKCDEAIAIEPDRPDIMARRAAALTNLDRIDDAIAAFEKVIELDPTIAACWSNLGTVWQTKNERQKAIDCFNKAVEVDPGFWHGWFCLATIETDNKKAIPFWDECVRSGPVTYMAYQNAANKYWEAGDYAGYYRTMRLSIQFPDCPEYTKQTFAMRLATTTQDEFRDGQAALKILQECAEANKQVNQSLPYQLSTYLAAAYAEIGDFDKAMQLLDARLETMQIPESIRMYESYQNNDPWRVDY